MVWAIVAALVALAYVGYLSAFILRQPRGERRVQELSNFIRQGAMAFLRREFLTLALFSIVMAIALYFVFDSFLKPLAYLLGTATSAFAGFIGMYIATKANGRTAHAASSSFSRALRIAFSAGAVMGFSVVGLGLLGLAVLAVIFPEESWVWLSYAFGATSVALFLRVGGGIFTKSADVGADLVGKVERGIPEDDPRNPAVIADNVGDNVGDVAGMGSDLYESYVSALAASMVLGLLYYGDKGVILSLLLGALGIGVSILGAFLVRAREVGASFVAQFAQAAGAMNRGVYVSNILFIVAAYFLLTRLGGDEGIGIFIAAVAGLVCGFLIGKNTEYFTSEKSPVLGIARSSTTGAATNIIEGFSMGMLSSVAPAIIIVIATMVAYYFAGLFGIAIASLGMLANLGILLAMDCYGPIADNAAGISEMAGLGPETRERAEALDAVGNTTAALGKGFAISSAALAALAWLATYFEVAKIKVISITDPAVISGLLIGAMLSFLLCALAMKGVSSGAFQVVQEVRRQFKEIAGLAEGHATPDYVKCVDIVTARALWSMMPLGLVVIVVPIIVGLALGPAAVGGVLAGALLSGLLLALTMANSGGAWDNAKKYIEAGHLGGKGSEAHKAAVIGDTVGDPFKDTAGPSLNILIKLVGKVAVIFAPLFLVL